MIRLTRPRTILAVASAAAAIAPVAACSPQPSMTSSPASLSATHSPRPHPTKSPRPRRTHTSSPTPTPTPTSLSPAPTTPSQSPTPTGTGTCVTGAAKGHCGPYAYTQVTGSSQDPYVDQNVWSPIPGSSQTLHATDPGNWYVTANMPAGNTAVVSYPNTGAAYGEQPLSGFTRITSSFSENMNTTSGTSAWAAYDLWFNNWRNEVMIQHDFANNGACPTLATATFGGNNDVPVQSWHFCKYGSELIWKLGTDDNHKVSEQSGSVDIKAMITWLEDHGYMPQNSTITNLSYGFEICSTGGQAENFQVTRYSLTAA